MTKEEFHLVFSKIDFCFIFWNKTSVFKCNSYSGESSKKKDRFIQGRNLFNIDEAKITEKNCEEFKFILTGEQQAIMHFATENVMARIRDI